ncbi:MAG: hypothetical protein WBV11_10520 [Salegentibacter sp.]
MKKIFALLFVSVLLFSCDSGNIVVTSFELQDSNLKLCGTSQEKVLYVINNGDVYESMSLKVSGSQFQDSLQNVLTTDIQDTLSLSLSSSNQLIYRLYSSEVPSNYFCNQIPPKEPQVVEEYWSSTGGTINITTSFNDENADSDTDGDGLKNVDEGWNANGTNLPDTDQDGIPNYLDKDDDGDNVSTRTEIATGSGDPTAEGYRDTDSDGTPNYLDPDDDNDGTPTRLEVSPDDLTNPGGFAEAEGIPNYLNDQISTAQPEHNLYINHNISRTYRSRVVLKDFKLVKQDGSGEEIRFAQYNLGYFISSSVPYPLTPSQATTANQ